MLSNEGLVIFNRGKSQTQISKVPGRCVLCDYVQKRLITYFLIKDIMVQNNVLPSETFFFCSLQCSFLPKFSIHIESKYEDNKGNNDNVSTAQYLKRFAKNCARILISQLGLDCRSFYSSVVCFIASLFYQTPSSPPSCFETSPSN